MEYKNWFKSLKKLSKSIKIISHSGKSLGNTDKINIK